jgi:catechol 2,3-dioxygenase-like lactoylglutathione lyase family enzyme
VFDHITIRVSDRAAAERFYNTVLPALESGDPWTHGKYTGWGHDFTLAQDDQPRTTGLHIAFVAPSQAHVDEFWKTGTEAGYVDDGAPGLRPRYGDDYYGGFLHDPDGNSVEAVDARPLAVHGAERLLLDRGREADRAFPPGFPRAGQSDGGGIPPQCRRGGLQGQRRPG